MISHTASHTSFVTSRLNGRDSKIANGTANWKITRNSPTKPQPPCKRRMYQVISSGRLPAQMINHWENEKYAHTMMNVSMNLPWSCTNEGRSSSDIGLYLNRMRSMTT